MEAKFLLLETSGAVGQVGLGLGSRVIAQQTLDIHYRHNRDLAPAVVNLLQRASWRPRDLQGVIVSRGPGSYTGLRVGIMSAKTLAYATGCSLITVNTFDCLVRQAPPDVCSLDVIADAQQGNVYTQTFQRDLQAGAWRAAAPLAIEPLRDWLARRSPTTWVTGPGLLNHAQSLGAAHRQVPSQFWLPKLEPLLESGVDRGTPLSATEVMALEPLYLRPSSAEQKWDDLGRGALNAP
jgi:tRNA threonylcarbamoyladenosine biosynthesis protein TsaB